MNRRNLIRHAIWLGAITVVAACSDGKAPAGSTEPLAPPASLRTRADSARADAWNAVHGRRLSVAAVASGVSIPLMRGDRVTILITSTECAKQGNTISVSGVLSGVVSTNACYESGKTLDLGAAAANGMMTFDGTGQFRLQGTYPLYIVQFEDGGDYDWNDVVLEVRIIPRNCDPILKDPKVAAVLHQLIANSHWDQPLADRREQGGYLVLDANQDPDLVPFSAIGSGLCHIQRDVAAQEQSLREHGYTIIGPIHTHPLAEGVVPNPGNCLTLDDRGNYVPVTGIDIQFRRGPSPTDLEPWSGSGDPRYAGYLLLPDHQVWRWEKDGTGRFHLMHYNLDEACPT
jgi:hypothetical protein